MAMQNSLGEIIDLSVGQPDFPTPAHIKEAGQRAIDANYTKYTPQPGFQDLREAAARKLRMENGLQVTSDQVVVSCGAKHSLYNVIQCLVKPGDEVVILSPAFPAYAAQVKLAGGQAIRVPTREANRFHPDSEAVRAAIGKATKVLIINSPCNPTGAVYSRATLARLAELAVEKGLWLIADEVYEKILFDGAEHVSIGSLGTEIGARTITVNSVSKTHSMTGWRIGYAAMPRALAEAVTYLQSQSTSGPCSISQRAALVALTAPAAHAVAMAQEYARRRDYLLERLARIDELSCCRPEGAFYLFVNCGKLIGRRLAGRTVANSAEFAQVLLEEARIRVIAGAMYGSDCHVRFSFAVSMSALDEGMNRLENLLARRAGVVFTTPPPVSSSPTEPQPNGEN